MKNVVKLKLLGFSSFHDKLFSRHIFIKLTFENFEDIHIYFERLLKNLNFPDEEIKKIDMIFTEGEDTFSTDRFGSKKFGLWVIYNKKYISLIFETERENREKLIAIIKNHCTFPPTANS